MDCGGRQAVAKSVAPLVVVAVAVVLALDWVVGNRAIDRYIVNHVASRSPLLRRVDDAGHLIDREATAVTALHVALAKGDTLGSLVPQGHAAAYPHLVPPLADHGTVVLLLQDVLAIVNKPLHLLGVRLGTTGQDAGTWAVAVLARAVWLGQEPVASREVDAVDHVIVQEPELVVKLDGVRNLAAVEVDVVRAAITGQAGDGLEFRHVVLSWFACLF